MSDELNKLKDEMNSTFGKFIDYTVDHIFDTDDINVRKNAMNLYDAYDKAYEEFRALYVSEVGHDSILKVADMTYVYANKRLAEYQ